MVSNEKILKSDLLDGKYTNNSSISMMCSSENQIPSINISIFIQWEGSNLDLPIPGKRHEKRYMVFKLITVWQTSITSQAHWNDFITAPYIDHIEISFLLWSFILHQLFTMKNSIALPHSCCQKIALSCEAVLMRSHAQKAVWIRYRKDSSSSYCIKHLLKRLHSQAPICYITWNTIPQLHTIKSTHLQSMIGLHIA